MVEISKMELDSALAALENPTRRKILERLNHEPAYALQLARELDLNQQLVEKHLKCHRTFTCFTSFTSFLR